MYRNKLSDIWFDVTHSLTFIRNRPNFKRQFDTNVEVCIISYLSLMLGVTTNSSITFHLLLNCPNLSNVLDKTPGKHNMEYNLLSVLQRIFLTILSLPVGIINNKDIRNDNDFCYIL